MSQSSSAAVLEYHIFTCVLPSKVVVHWNDIMRSLRLFPIADSRNPRFVDIDGRWVHHGPRVQLWVPAGSYRGPITLSSELEDSMSGVLNAGYEGIMVYASSGCMNLGNVPGI